MNNSNIVDIYFSRENENVKLPEKRKEDAGYDIYAYFENDAVLIEPGEIALINTGIRSCIPDNYVFMLKERGSTGTKGLSVRSGIIDSGYRGEWMVPINNTSNRTIVISKTPEMYNKNKLTIYPYEKAIAQALLLPVPETNIIEINKDELMNFESERGTGRLGSSNK